MSKSHIICSEDSLTGNSYAHRKPRVVDRLKESANIFAIEVCAYVVMSNHYHVVLHVDAQTAKSCSDWEVLQRWTKLFDGPPLVQQFLAGKILRYCRVWLMWVSTQFVLA